MVNRVDQLEDAVPVIPTPTAPTHQLPHAAFTALATPARGSRETSVWRVVIAPGTPGVPHQVTREEIFVVLGGAARVMLADVEATATVGDAIVVPPETRFQIDLTARAAAIHSSHRCGINSVVECQLPKLNVVGSNPISRSKLR
jgi:mannose-6-phosphate isomerase-like protein (cupin superfamily)